MSIASRIVPRSKPLGLLGVALLLVLGQLGASLHYVVVQHTTCPEHGEAIHTEAPPEAHVAHHERHATERSWSADPATAPNQHEHSHCTLAVEVRTWLQRDAVPPTPATPPRTLAVVSQVAASIEAPSGPIYLLAPKASPPV